MDSQLIIFMIFHDGPEHVPNDGTMMSIIWDNDDIHYGL